MYTTVRKATQWKKGAKDRQVFDIFRDQKITIFNVISDQENS